MTHDRESRDARRRAGRRAFTLVEVVFGLVVMGMVALSALGGLLFSYRTSDANLRAIAALANARAVAAQIMTLDYTTLAGTSLPVDIPSSSTGTLTVNQWNARTDDMHGTTGDASDNLVLSIRPEITQSNDLTGFACSQVIVRYRWEETAYFATRTHEDALTFYVSNVATY